MLGAIINPSAFLPYATGAATFVAIISSKYSEFAEIAENGRQMVLDVVEKQMGNQINGLMKRVDLSGKVDAVIDSGAFKDIAGSATKMGLISPATLTNIQQNAENIAKDPTKFAKGVGGQLEDFAKDPGA